MTQEFRAFWAARKPQFMFTSIRRASFSDARVTGWEDGGTDAPVDLKLAARFSNHARPIRRYARPALLLEQCDFNGFSRACNDRIRNHRGELQPWTQRRASSRAAARHFASP